MSWEIVLTAIATFVASEFSKATIKDSYESLKSKILAKFGDNHKLTVAVNEFESNSDSIKRRQQLGVELQTEESNLDDDIIGTAQTLLNLVEPDQDKQEKLVFEAGRDIKNLIYNSPGAKIVNKVKKK